MAPHPRRGRDRSLQIDLPSFLKRAEVCATQRLGRDADFEEGRGVEFGDGKAGPVYANAVAEGGVAKDRGAVRNGEGGPGAARGGGIERGKGADRFKGVRVSEKVGNGVGGEEKMGERMAYCRWSRLGR
jgi:hypothetical protein